MTVHGEVERPEDREGFMGLREIVADGMVDGQDYTVTQNPGSGTVSVEFPGEDGTTSVDYRLNDMVLDAYSKVYGDGDAVDRWQEHAAENVERWGNQPVKVLVAALAEELAEVADELYEDPNDSPLDARLFAIRTAGYEAREYLENEFEDSEGDPLPTAAYPYVSTVANAEGAADELDDMAPLVFQLKDALDRATEGGGE